MSKFKIGDRVVLHNMHEDDEDGSSGKSPWRNGTPGTITAWHDDYSGHQPKLADGSEYNDNEGSYGVRFDGYDYGDSPGNCHTASERILTIANDWPEQEVAKLFGLTPAPPEPHCKTCTCQEEA